MDDCCAQCLLGGFGVLMGENPNGLGPPRRALPNTELLFQKKKLTLNLAAPEASPVFWVLCCLEQGRPAI